MKRTTLAAGMLTLLALSGGVIANAQSASPTNFTVKITNVSGNNTSKYADVGIVGVPVGATQRAAITPGQSYDFVVKAQPGDSLTFATMYGQSNDSFLGPDEKGIALFDASGKAISGDVSSQVE
ncbi:MAG TPA: spondin domain-containing protein, partial [Phototrophicaceae bacterium]|nr:spondin domain-containing protein [Phototrophicaceae bacterium]